MFIIYAAFTFTDKKLKTKERIGLTLKNAGVAITITSLTDFMAFIIGTTTGFRSVQIFCLYAGKIFFVWLKPFNVAVLFKTN